MIRFTNDRRTRSLRGVTARAAAAMWIGGVLSLSILHCPARTISLEGIGISIRQVGQIYRYKGDHMDTRSWDRGLIFPMTEVPSRVEGMDYAYHDWRPASEDSRTNDTITRIRTDESGDLLIALPSADASGAGWTRLTGGRGADFHLESAGRGRKPKPDPDSPYWFYQFRDAPAGRWLPLPDLAGPREGSPFVFAGRGELRWENPPPLMGNAVIITRKNPKPVASTLANPNLTILSNGDYLAMISNSVDGTALFRSIDRGLHWQRVRNGFEVNVFSVFEHRDGLYVIGKNTRGRGQTRIYRSVDGGRSWEDKVFAGYGGGDAPSHVDVSDGRIWKAAHAGKGPGFYSAPVDADLMDESSWTLSSGTYDPVELTDGTRFRNGNEGTLLKAKDGTLFSVGKSRIYRPDLGWRAGVTTQQPDPTDLAGTTWNPDHAGAVIPQESGKFTMRYDPVSDRYWTLVGGENRGQINLYSAPAEGRRIGDFEFRGTILDSESNSFQGFNYPFMQIDGEDLVFSLRTAWDTPRGRSTRWHDGNLFTFHRVRNFREREGPGNYLANPGFEEGIAGWYSTPAGSVHAQVSDRSPRSGSGHLVHRSEGGPYQVLTYKSVLSLANGSYTLSAWLRRLGEAGTCKLGVSDYGGPPRSLSVPESTRYSRIEIPHINVTEGKCRIGLWSDAGADAWVEMDDVAFTRDEGPRAGKSYRIIARHSQKALSVAGDATIVQADLGAAGSVWELRDGADGSLRIVSRSAGTGLRLGRASREGDAEVTASSDPDGHSRWKLVPAGDAYFQIVSESAGDALQVTNGSLDRGARVRPSARGYAEHQVWRFLPVD